MYSGFIHGKLEEASYYNIVGMLDKEKIDLSAILKILKLVGVAGQHMINYLGVCIQVSINFRITCVLQMIVQDVNTMVFMMCISF